MQPLPASGSDDRTTRIRTGHEPTPPGRSGSRPGAAVGGVRPVASSLLALQRSAGNAAVERMLSSSRSAGTGIATSAGAEIDGAEVTVQRDTPILISPGSSSGQTARRGTTQYPVEEPRRTVHEPLPPDAQRVIGLIPAALVEWAGFKANGFGPDTARQALAAACGAVYESRGQGPDGVALRTRDDLANLVGAPRLALIGEMLRWDKYLAAGRLSPVRAVLDNHADGAFYESGTRFAGMNRAISQTYSMSGDVGYKIDAEVVATDFHGTLTVSYRNEYGMAWSRVLRITAIGLASLENALRRELTRVHVPEARQRSLLARADTTAIRHAPAGLDLDLGVQGSGSFDQRGAHYSQSVGPGVAPPTFTMTNVESAPAHSYFTPAQLEDASVEMHQVSVEATRDIGPFHEGYQFNITHDITLRRHLGDISALTFDAPPYSVTGQASGGASAGIQVSGRVSWVFGGTVPGAAPPPLRQPVPPPPPPTPVTTRGRTGEWRPFLVTTTRFDTGAFSSPEVDASSAEAVARSLSFLAAHPDYELRVDVRGHASPQWRAARGAQARQLNWELSTMRLYAVLRRFTERLADERPAESIRSRLHLVGGDAASGLYSGAGSSGAASFGVDERSDPPEWRRVDIMVEYSEYEQVTHQRP